MTMARSFREGVLGSEFVVPENISEGKLESSWIKWLVIAIVSAFYVPTSLAEDGAKPPPTTKGQTLKAYAVINHTGDSFLIKSDNVADTENLTIVEISDIRAVPPALPGSIPAKVRLTELVIGKPVIIHVVDIRKYGSNITIIGQVNVDGVDVAEILIREGLAWVASGSRNPTLLAIEKDAKARKVGLWGMAEYQKERPYHPAEQSPVGTALKGYVGIFAGWQKLAGFVLLVIAAFVFWRGSRRVRSLQIVDPRPVPDFKDVARFARRLFLLSFSLPALLILALVLGGMLFAGKSEGPRTYAFIFALLAAAILPPFAIMGLVLRAWVRRIGTRGYFHFSSAKYTGVAAWVGSYAGVAFLLTQVPGESILIPPFMLWPVIVVSAVFGAIASALIGYLLWTLQLSRGQKSMALK